jgi:hypothetical protein
MNQLLNEPARKSPPVSEARRAAGQRNGRLAAGKKSEAGRKASAQNAHKHGYYARTFTVLPTERQEKFDALRRDLINQMQPANDRQFRLLEQIVKNHWLLWRNYSYEDAALTAEVETQFHKIPADAKPPGTKLLSFFAFDALAQRNGTLTLIYRLRAQLNRELNRDYKQYDQFKKQDAATAHDAAIPPYPDVAEDDMFQPPTPEHTTPEHPAPEDTIAEDPAVAPDALPNTASSIEAPQHENSSNEGNRDAGNEPSTESPQLE